MSDRCNQCQNFFMPDASSINHSCYGCNGDVCHDCYEDLRSCQGCGDLFCIECVEEKTTTCAHCGFINCNDCNDSEDLFKDCCICENIFCIDNCENLLHTCTVCFSNFICNSCFDNKQKYVKHICSKGIYKSVKIDTDFLICTKCEKVTVCVDCFEISCPACKLFNIGNKCYGVNAKKGLHRYIPYSTISEPKDILVGLIANTKILIFVNLQLTIEDIKSFLLEKSTELTELTTLAFVNTNCSLIEITLFLAQNNLSFNNTTLKKIIFK